MNSHGTDAPNRRNVSRIANTATAATVAIVLSLGGDLVPASAYATSVNAKASESAKKEIAEAQKQIDSSAAAYNAARSRLDSLQKDIDETTGSINRLEKKLPEQKKSAGAAMKELYKYRKGSNAFITSVMNAESLSDFLTVSTYMDQITSANTSKIEQLAKTQEKLQKEKDELEQSKAAIQEQQKQAASALATAQKVRADAQAKAEAEAAAQVAAEKKAEEANKPTIVAGKGADGDNSKKTATATNQKINSTPLSNNVNWSSDHDAFINKWAGRIDKYLAGSPLAGHGRTFAEAAWNNGVDPRWSPAISTIESGKGAVCFRPHNAWGWMGKSFGDWDTAINAHVAYLRKVYGTTLTPAAAKTYCPPTWQDWYNKVSAQMNMI